jgi:glycosyltransferase involved in cell wall biosynthesis
VADVAVVVPARNAATTLPRTLAALRAQTYGGALEVVVADDGSADGTPELARAAGATVVASRGGPAEARDLGVAATIAPLIAFTDADCFPAARWIEHGAAALDAGADLVQGPILPEPGAAIGPWDRTLYARDPSPLFQTANLLVTREAYDRAGGFARRIPLPAGEKSFGEDVLFGWAVKRGGGRVAWAPEALVHHAVFPRGARGFVAERERLQWFPALVREVPELRSALPLRVFLSARTAAFDLAVGGVLTRRPWLALPYLAMGPHRPRQLAVHAVADAVGLAALVRGSARSRTIVL